MKQPIETVNMTRQYRDELKTLNQNGRKLKRDWQHFKRDAEGQLKRIAKLLQRGGKATAKELQRIEKRQAILLGRLS